MDHDKDRPVYTSRKEFERAAAKERFKMKMAAGGIYAGMLAAVLVVGAAATALGADSVGDRQHQTEHSAPAPLKSIMRAPAPK